jgi:hypothetical protein
LNIQFGSGVLFANPSAGNLPTNPTPQKFGVLQEVNVDFKADLKKLYGQLQFPVATARGKFEVTLKGKLAVFDVALLNQLYFAQPQALGYNLIVDGESQTAAANAVTVTNTPIIEDWGVIYSATGQPLVKVASNVQVGQYSGPNLTSGKYTLNSADNGAVLKVSYTYAYNAGGQTITLANQLMGYAPELTMFLYNKFRNKYFALELNDVTLGAIAIPTKLEDFWVADFEGSANADASNTLGKLMLDVV